MCSLFNARVSEIWKTFPLLDKDIKNGLISYSNKYLFYLCRQLFKAPIIIIPSTTKTSIMPSSLLHREKLDIHLNLLSGDLSLPLENKTIVDFNRPGPTI